MQRIPKNLIPVHERKEGGFFSTPILSEAHHKFDGWICGRVGKDANGVRFVVTQMDPEVLARHITILPGGRHIRAHGKIWPAGHVLADPHVHLAAPIEWELRDWSR